MHQPVVALVGTGLGVVGAREVASSTPREGQKPVNEAVDALLTRTFKAWWIDEEGRRDYNLVGAFAAHASGKASGIENGSSPADIAANLAGMRWYTELATLLAKAPKDPVGLDKLLAENPVRIDTMVDESWDEARNPNVRTLEQAPR